MIVYAMPRLDCASPIASMQTTRKPRPTASDAVPSTWGIAMCALAYGWKTATMQYGGNAKQRVECSAYCVDRLTPSEIRELFP